MNRKNLVRLLKIKGIILFLIFIQIPFLLIFLRQFLLNSNFFITNTFLNTIINDDIFIITLNYILFFLILLLLILVFKRKAISFITRENWFHSMEKAFKPAIIAFGAGLLTTAIVFMTVNLIPGIEIIKKWLSAPNEGFLIIFESLKDDNFFKVIFLFFLIIIIGPLYEEIIFRGFLQEGIRRLFRNSKYTIIAVALVFSIAHFASLSNMIFAFVVGIFLSKKRIENANINTTIWIHSIINFTGLLSGIIYKYLENFKF